ncbi:MAG: hypothetical protein QW670_06015 [Candidatus Bathyarchaeia archaeon]|nr:hypothetical protein [Thermoproteota archaeon]
MKTIRTSARQLLISLRLAKVVRIIDTAVYVYTWESLITFFSLIGLTVSVAYKVEFLFMTPSILLLVGAITYWTAQIYSEAKACSTIIKRNKQIFFNIRGGFIEVKRKRMKRIYKLGSLLEKQTRRLRLYIHTIGFVPQNIGIQVIPNKTPPEFIEVQISEGKTVETLEPEQRRSIKYFDIQFWPKQALNHRFSLELRVSIEGKEFFNAIFLINRVISKNEKIEVIKLCVERWKHGKKAAFVWRGDFDYFWPAKAMDENALMRCLDLSYRYGVPLTLFLSGRLTLDEEQWVRFALRYRIAENCSEARSLFTQFIKFLKSLNFRQEIEYPTQQNAISIGNHSYLHHGGPTGASDVNGWNETWKLGEGKKQWLYALCPNFSGEQFRLFTFHQLNAGLINMFLIKEKLGIDTRCWAAPRNESLPSMAKELEEIGILYASEADNYPRISKVFFPRRPKHNVCYPYHPQGCKKLIESRCVINPLDPSNVHDVICVKKSIKYAIARSKQITLLIHPHLRVHRPNKSLPYVERIFQYLCDNEDQIWLTSHESMLRFWELTRCSKHAVVKFEVGDRAIVYNESDYRLESVPIYIRLSSGDEMLWVIDLEPRQKVNLLE